MKRNGTLPSLRMSMKAIMGAAALVPALLMALPMDSASGERLLLEQIRLGERLIRDDIVEDAVLRLYRIQQDHPQGALARLRIATRLGQLDEARAQLEVLKRVAPQSEARRIGQVLIKLTTPEANAALTEGRLYSAVGRVDTALAIYDALLEGIYPTADLTLEYWQLYGRQPGERPTAIRQLRSALDTYPKHVGMLMALASMLFSEDLPDDAREYLRQLAQQDEHREAAASREFTYLLTLPVSEPNRALWQDFVEHYPDLVITTRARTELATQQALLNDPAWLGGQQGLAMVEQGKGAQAVERLRKAVSAYPDNVQFLGALGSAYLRSGEHRRALNYFELARQKEPRADKTSKWVSLIDSTRHWIVLNDASDAVDKQDWVLAKRLYEKALRQRPQSPFALVGMGDVALGLGQGDAAWRYYEKALGVAPQEGVAHRGVLRYLNTQSPEQALRRLDELPAHHGGAFSDARRDLTVRLLIQQADQAAEEQRWQVASDALKKAQDLDPDDPWLSYRLARSLREQGLQDEGLQAFHTHLSRHSGSPSSHYAHGLLLALAEQWQAALDTLAMAPKSAWDDDMLALETRVLDTQLIHQAQAYYDAGHKDAAIALLEQRPQLVSARLQVAQWSYDDGDYPKALSNYRAVLRMEEDNVDARLGKWETWLAQGKSQAVHHALSKADLDYQAESTRTYRRVAELWVAVGEPERARSILQTRASQVAGAEPLLFRDLARLTSRNDPQQALDLYARAMTDANLLPAQAAQRPRDDVAFTRAMRLQESDGWLERGVRREAQALYQQQNPTLTVHNDHWWRSDGTPGLSRLNANTTMVQIDYPIRQGKGFVRFDHVRMDAGTLKVDPDGLYRGEFGSCSFSATNVSGGWQPSSGCRSGLKQRAQGTSIGVGWTGERLSFDLGTTPLGFEVKNWTGGISYMGDMGPTGWRLTASRRPMSNSLLSFAGAKDPATGLTWGGVMATGAALSLSWDRGEANGVWADISHHRLTGRNVADNHRTRLMGGYYRRLINKDDETFALGINAMHWRYQKDLGDYSLGQGGYYSPKRYSSVSLPISYAKRSSNWSFLLEGSVSASFARSGDSDRYSRGVGYRLAGFVERRLTNHWVAGGGIDWQHSKDYSPSRFTLYLRYSFQPWRGSLPLAPQPLIPYADFK